MPRPLVVHLTADQHAELIQAHDHHPKPYLRERAAAVLKVAAGTSVRQVALRGLLRRRSRGAVSEWIQRYEQEGLPELLARALAEAGRTL